MGQSPFQQRHRTVGAVARRRDHHLGTDVAGTDRQPERVIEHLDPLRVVGGEPELVRLVDPQTLWMSSPDRPRRSRVQVQGRAPVEIDLTPRPLGRAERLGRRRRLGEAAEGVEGGSPLLLASGQQRDLSSERGDRCERGQQVGLAAEAAGGDPQRQRDLPK